ncbi:MAG: stage V sporulation protein S [Christensenellales bacterium]
MEPLRVSAKSSPKAVAGALTAALKEHNKAEILAVGAAAVNQAIKAVAIARGYLAPVGIDLAVIPAFTNVDIDGVLRTSINLNVIIR